jgi:hypothetical protein
LAVLAAAAHKASASLTPEEAKNIVAQGAFSGDASYSLWATKDRDQPIFYEVEAAWDNPHGSMIAGHFAVNAETGTLWNLQGSVCNVIANARLARLQRVLRARFTADPRAFAKVSSKRPLACSIISRTRAGLTG